MYCYKQDKWQWTQSLKHLACGRNVMENGEWYEHRNDCWVWYRRRGGRLYSVHQSMGQSPRAQHARPRGGSDERTTASLRIACSRAVGQWPSPSTVWDPRLTRNNHMLETQTSDSGELYPLTKTSFTTIFMWGGTELTWILSLRFERITDWLINRYQCSLTPSSLVGGRRLPRLLRSDVAHNLEYEKFPP